MSTDTGQVLGNYRLLKKLATGGMAEVWLARQVGIEGFKRTLVVKRILPHLADDPLFVQMLLNEARIAARLSHPNIAQIYDLGEADGVYFIAMEYVHGENLGRIMRKAWTAGKWVSQAVAIKIISSCCEGLGYAHAKTDESGHPLKLVHRDVSPANVLVTFEGSVKLVDFGIAKAADTASLTKSGAIKGKFAYMSPEQASGRELDHRADIFSAGLVLYELLTGVRPYQRDHEFATLHAAREGSIKPPSAVADVPRDLDPVVMRALARDPGDRYRDAAQFQMALEEYLVAQRQVVTATQIAQLMRMLFQSRLDGGSSLGTMDPGSGETPIASVDPVSGMRSAPDVSTGVSSPGINETKILPRDLLSDVDASNDPDREENPTNVFADCGPPLRQPLKRRARTFSRDGQIRTRWHRRPKQRAVKPRSGAGGTTQRPAGGRSSAKGSGLMMRFFSKGAQALGSLGAMIKSWAKSRGERA